MEKECAGLLSKVEVRQKVSLGYTKVFEAVFEGVPFLIGISGIGKGFAAAAVAAIANRYPVDAFLNIGIAGSQDKTKADIFSVVIGSHYVEHDLDTSAIGDPVGLISGIDIVELPSSPLCVSCLEKASNALHLPYAHGVISSGDTFIGDKAKKRKVTETFGSLCLDMESAPFAQIAFVYDIPFASARVISDCERPEIEYPKNAEKASQIASNLALEAVRFFAESFSLSV